jgi:polyphosphate kinase
MGLKTHCKMLLIIRQEKDGLVHYVHLSSGNYNEKTAQLYTDIGFMTCDKSIGQDVSELFNVLTGYSKQENWRRILVAPVNMREGFESLIQQTIQHHSPENPSSIKIQLNSLVDPEMIEALYKASCHGIKIELIIRGICCLIPGIPLVSENITVRSIVGRFLEHARICIFQYNGEQHIYCSSADWMPRNLNRRVEVAFPILDPVLKRQIIEIMDYMLNDNIFARILQPDGSYQHVEIPPNKKPFAAQTRFLQAAILRQKSIDTTMAVSG